MANQPGFTPLAAHMEEDQPAEQGRGSSSRRSGGSLATDPDVAAVLAKAAASRRNSMTTDSKRNSNSASHDPNSPLWDDSIVPYNRADARLSRAQDAAPNTAVLRVQLPKVLPVDYITQRVDPGASFGEVSVVVLDSLEKRRLICNKSLFQFGFKVKADDALIPPDQMLDTVFNKHDKIKGVILVPITTRADGVQEEAVPALLELWFGRDQEEMSKLPGDGQAEVSPLPPKLLEALMEVYETGRDEFEAATSHSTKKRGSIVNKGSAAKCTFPTHKGEMFFLRFNQIASNHRAFESISHAKGTEGLGTVGAILIEARTLWLDYLDYAKALGVKTASVSKQLSFLEGIAKKLSVILEQMLANGAQLSGVGRVEAVPDCRIRTLLGLVDARLKHPTFSHWTHQDFVALENEQMEFMHLQKQVHAWGKQGLTTMTCVALCGHFASALGMKLCINDKTLKTQFMAVIKPVIYTARAMIWDHFLADFHVDLSRPKEWNGRSCFDRSHAVQPTLRDRALLEAETKSPLRPPPKLLSNVNQQQVAPKRLSVHVPTTVVVDASPLNL